FLRMSPHTDTYTLSLHDALPICLWDKGGDRKLYEEKMALDSLRSAAGFDSARLRGWLMIGAGVLLVAAVTVSLRRRVSAPAPSRDRKSTRLNSSHVKISYAVFCL